MISDLKNGAVFPTRHPLHPKPPGMFLPTASAKLIRGAAAHTSIEPVYALRACQALAADGVIPRDLRSAPGALAALAGALRSSGLIPPTPPSGAGPDPIAAAVDYSYL